MWIFLALLPNFNPTSRSLAIWPRMHCGSLSLTFDNLPSLLAFTAVCVPTSCKFSSTGTSGTSLDGYWDLNSQVVCFAARQANLHSIYNPVTANVHELWKRCNLCLLLRLDMHMRSSAPSWKGGTGAFLPSPKVVHVHRKSSM